MNEKKQYEVLKWAFSFLKKHNREKNVAEILLQHHLDVPRHTFYTLMQEEVPASIREKFISDIKKHAVTGVPVQHLTGYEYFYGRKFKVNENVLVPRFETEELVQQVIKLVETNYKNEPITIVDIGTGSGVIAISLALELSNASIYATDISSEALEIATINAKTYSASVTFLEGDFMQPILEKGINPQIIVSNPPYIKKDDRMNLPDTVKNFDPEIALFAKNNGLAAYERIITQVKSLPIDTERTICFEIGYDQAEDITTRIISHYPSSDPKTYKDINEKDRIILARI